MTPPAPDPDYEQKTRESFNRQAVMQTIGATLESIKPGGVTIELPFNAQYTQQNDFMHAGIISTVLDSACGYAAFTLMPAGADVLTVEFKVNLLRPAKGKFFTAKARVVKAGLSISVTEASLFSSDYGEKEVATMSATMMAIYA
ncbi:MAG: PaaI family thioesterase [Gammaproteobacteria bacterium]|nr:PaaI family thioesterase [Gammaproteobacteria bacterium]